MKFHYCTSQNIYKGFRKISLVLLFILLMSTPIYAADILDEEKTDTAVTSEKTMIKALAFEQVKEYIASEEGIKLSQIALSDDFVELYDIDEEVSGYLIPITRKSKEIGYLSVNAYNGTCIVQEISLDRTISQKFKDRAKSSSTRSANAVDSSKIIFIPPMNYIYKSNNSRSNTYTTAEGNDITEAVRENVDNIRKLDDAVKSKATERKASALRTTVSVQDVRLTREAKGKFVPVKSVPNIGTAYGGNQSWWADKTKRSTGCGPVAAANVTQYLASKSTSKYGKLYPYSSTSYTNFLKHMDAMYDLIKPGSLGEPFVWDFKNKVVGYAACKGVQLTPSVLTAVNSRDRYASFVKAGLNSDVPVACLNIQPFGYEYGAHWMTITKYFRDSADNRWVAVSTWGRRTSVDFDTWYNSTYMFGGGLVYFK